jgi:hypothetical protein
MPVKRVQIDNATWRALTQLATDRVRHFQELADEVFADLLAKHGRPTDLKTVLRRSLEETGKKPGAVRDVVGISRGAVSGQLMVSDQAARSIG